MKTQLLTIAISAISIGRLNHRKNFEPTAMKELQDSIKEKGILQPLLVRPLGKDKYELVCGERRLRAATLAGLKEIPVSVMEMTDDEAMEAQVIENLQRVDVHPMEEALAFKNLMQTKGKKIEEIAAHIGKSGTYVAQRLKLNDLILPFQKAVLENRMTLILAKRVCVLNEKDQKALWKDEDCDNENEVEINDWTFNKFSHSLNKASFDITDANLNPKMGGCIGCPHNTASNTLLFPESATESKCLLIECFESKIDASYKKQIELAIADPAVILINRSYEQTKEVKELIKKGHDILAQEKYEIIEEPETITREEFNDENKYEIENDWSKKEADDNFKKQCNEIEKESKEYKKNLESGKYVKAFVVEGNPKGKYVYVSIEKKNNKASKEKGKANDGKVNVQAEIKRMADAETRKKELDECKMQANYFEVLKKDKAYVTDKPLTKNEMVAQVLFLKGLFQWQTQARMHKETGLKDGDKNKMYMQLNKTPTPALQKMINKMTRLLVFDLCKPQNNAFPGNSNTCSVLVNIVKEFSPIKAKKVLEDQMVERKKRETRLNERIAQLKKVVTPKKK